MKMRAIVFGIAVLVLLAELSFLYVGGNTSGAFIASSSNDTIKIGALTALSGDYAAYGLNEKNSIELALFEINANGGILKKKVEVIYEDSKCNGAEATIATQKLVEVDEVKIILGGSCSSETLAAAPITEKNKVILFSSFSSSPKVTTAGDFVFRNSPSDADSGKGSAQMIYDSGAKTVAILAESTDFAEGVKAVLKESLSQLGVKVVADEIYSSDSKDYRSQLTKIKSAHPDAIFFDAQTGISGGLAVKQAKELGIDANYFGHFVFSSPDAFANGGEALNGMFFVDAPGLSESNPKSILFMQKYLEKYPKPASDYQAGARYDSVFIIKNAIESCKMVNTECIRDYLYNLPQYSGTIGTYHFDSNGDEIGVGFAVKQIVDVSTQKVVTLK